VNWPTEGDFVNAYMWYVDEDGDFVRNTALRREIQDGWLVVAPLGISYAGIYAVLDGQHLAMPREERDRLIADAPDWAKRHITAIDDWTEEEPEALALWDQHYADRWKEARA
jgi:hypothetical protein